MSETAIQSMEREYELARKLRDADRRARSLVDMAVAYALQARGEPDEFDFRRYAQEVALDACACLIRQIYDNDAELSALRQERDEYKKRALEFANFAPPRIFIQSITDPEGLAQGIAARSGETTEIGSTEGKSPVAESDAP